MGRGTTYSTLWTVKLQNLAITSCCSHIVIAFSTIHYVPFHHEQCPHPKSEVPHPPLPAAPRPLGRYSIFLVHQLHSPVLPPDSGPVVAHTSLRHRCLEWRHQKQRTKRIVHRHSEDPETNLFRHHLRVDIMELPWHLGGPHRVEVVIIIHHPSSKVALPPPNHSPNNSQKGLPSLVVVVVVGNEFSRHCKMEEMLGVPTYKKIS